MVFFSIYSVISSNSTWQIMKRNRNGISPFFLNGKFLFLKRKITGQSPSTFAILTETGSTVCQLCVTEMLHGDWAVAGRLMRQMSLTRTHHATVVGPIRFSNRSNNCRVCKINGRHLSLVRTHHATIVFSSSLRPTDNKNRMVCAGLPWDQQDSTRRRVPGGAPCVDPIHNILW